MKFIVFLMAVLIVVALLHWVVKHGKVEFVLHAKLLFKTWSVWLASIGSVAGAWVQSFPDSAISAWNGLPEDVKSILPQHYLGFIASFMVAMAVVSQFIRQKPLLVMKNVITGGKS
ncbi:hypothetical protein [Erwinia tasmaniensis]|uniref:DUF7940 domain-containing protein n=1 Tax=Erwinia tasmaniensis TaxID=338565 RepID=UPI003A4DFCB7